MKETFYFSHDYSARSDEKIKRLLRKYSMEGYGIYWAIIEDLYNNANALRLDYEGIAYELRVDENSIKSIINDFDLFVIEGEVFGSISVQRRLDERNEKSLKAKESANKRWSDVKKNANALQSKSERNTIKESKGKESKVKESKESKENESKLNQTAYEFLSLSIPIQLEQLWMKNRDKLSKKDDIVEHYNDDVIVKGIEWDAQKLLARLSQLIRNWKNETTTPGLKPISKLTENEIMGMPFHKMQEYGQAGIDEIQALKREIYKRNGYN